MLRSRRCSALWSISLANDNIIDLSYNMRFSSRTSMKSRSKMKRLAREQGIRMNNRSIVVMMVVMDMGSIATRISCTTFIVALLLLWSLRRLALLGLCLLPLTWVLIISVIVMEVMMKIMVDIIVVVMMMMVVGQMAMLVSKGSRGCICSSTIWSTIWSTWHSCTCRSIRGSCNVLHDILHHGLQTLW